MKRVSKKFFQKTAEENRRIRSGEYLSHFKSDNSIITQEYGRLAIMVSDEQGRIMKEGLTSYINPANY